VAADAAAADAGEISSEEVSEDVEGRIEEGEEKY